MFQLFLSYNSFIICHKSIEKSPWGARHPLSSTEFSQAKTSLKGCKFRAILRGPTLFWCGLPQPPHQSAPLSVHTTMFPYFCCSVPPYLYVLSNYPSQFIFFRKKSLESLWQKRKSRMSLSFLLISPTASTFFYNWKLQFWLWSLFRLKSPIQRCTDKDKFNLTIISHF